MKHSLEYISILSDAWNHPRIYEDAYLNIENYSFEYLEMFHRTPGNFHLNSRRYSFYYVKCWLRCMNTILCWSWNQRFSNDLIASYQWAIKAVQLDRLSRFGLAYHSEAFQRHRWSCTKRTFVAHWATCPQLNMLYQGLVWESNPGHLRDRQVY